VPPTPIIETRLIYTQGLYKLSDAMRSCRQITIVSDLLRFPKFTVYANEKSNPPYYFLGYYTIWTGDYVQERRALEFTEQALLLYDNPVLQASNLLLAVGSRIQDTIQALGSVMTPPAPIILLPQPDVSAEACPYTDIKFKMPLGTRIQVTAVGIPLEEYGDVQGVAPSLHQPADTVPRYPLDRDPSQDPPRSEPYVNEVPGDTAPATADDPDAGIPPVVCTLTFENRRSDQPSYVGYSSVTVPNASYNSAYVDVVSNNGSTYTYYARSNGNLGVITLGGPFNPPVSVTITYSNFAVSCV